MRRMIVPFLSGLALLTLASTARSHDLKVMLARLTAAPGELDTVYISYGHILPVENQIDASTLNEYYVRTPSGSVNYLKKEGTSLQSNEIHVDEEGTYQAVATRKAMVFTEVVDKAGNHSHVRGPKSSVKEGTIDHGTRSHQYAKALMLSGAKAEKALEPLGHEIEIVPLDGPDGWKSGRDLKFKVLFQGKPLTGADVVATYVGFKPDNAWCYATSTSPKGIAEVRPSQAGTWVVRAKTQRPADKDDQKEFDFDAYSATLVFEVRP